MTKAENRPSWETYFMNIANLVSQRATCLRRAVGAVLVKDKRILATGYNGTPANLKHCAEVGCLREQLGIESGKMHELCRGIHAEQNAIIQAAYHGVSVKGAVIYCTNQPCSICARMIINAGIVKIYYQSGYADALAKELLGEANIELKQIESDNQGER
jgi:dCMP deaminase